jgi:hypothetical protein
MSDHICEYQSIASGDQPPDEGWGYHLSFVNISAELWDDIVENSQTGKCVHVPKPRDADAAFVMRAVPGKVLIVQRIA